MRDIENKEDFCPACVAVPLAMAGVGLTGAGSTQDKKSNKKSKTIMLVIGLSITLISLVVGIVYLTRCKDCR